MASCTRTTCSKITSWDGDDRAEELRAKQGKEGDHSCQLCFVQRKSAHLADPLRMLRQKHLQRMQLLRYPFDVIQPIHTDDNLAPSKPLLQALKSRLHRIFSEAIDELHRLDPDGIRADLSVAAFQGDPVWHGLEAEDTGAGGEEVSGIVVGVEAVQSLASREKQYGATYPMRSHCRTPRRISLRTGRILRPSASSHRVRSAHTGRSRSTGTGYARRTLSEPPPSPSPSPPSPASETPTNP